MNEMTILEPEGGAVTFPASPDEVERILTEIAARAKAHVPDLDTAKGRKEIASVASQVARSKTALDEAGKKLTEDARAEIARVDLVRRTIRERLDALKAEIRKPLTDWEEAEAKRVHAEQARVEAIAMMGRFAGASAEIRAQMTALDAVEITKEIFTGGMLTDALHAAHMARIALAAALEAATQREAQEAELADLRRRDAEREAREAKDRAEREAREAKERERQAAEKAAAAAARREIEEARAAAAAAEARARAAEEAAARAAQAERDRIEREAREAKERAAAEAKADADRKRAEKDRADAENKAAEEAKKRRFASIERMRIAISAEADLTNDQAAQVVAAILAGSIPHVGFRP